MAKERADGAAGAKGSPRFGRSAARALAPERANAANVKIDFMNTYSPNASVLKQGDYFAKGLVSG
jgi:hypothetical protein